MNKRLEYFTKDVIQIDNKHMKHGLTSLTTTNRKLKQ